MEVRASEKGLLTKGRPYKGHKTAHGTLAPAWQRDLPSAQQLGKHTQRCENR
jgi:hypothetical protein